MQHFHALELMRAAITGRALPDGPAHREGESAGSPLRVPFPSPYRDATVLPIVSPTFGEARAKTVGGRPKSNIEYGWAQNTPYLWLICSS